MTTATALAAPRSHAIPFDRLERALASWLPCQRWYAAKGRPLDRVSIEEICPFTDADPASAAQGLILVTRTHFGDGGACESYQVPIGVRPAATTVDGPHVIAVLDDLVVYEALGDSNLVRDFVDLVATDADRARLTFRSEPPAEGMWPPPNPITTSRLLGAEQSNTSIVVDDRYLLKIFRRLHVGTNPDLELQRALHRSSRSPVPPLHGAVEGEMDGSPVTYAVLQRFLPDTEDGWTAALRQLAEDPGNPYVLAHDAYRMGAATGTVHAGLEASFGTRTLDPRAVEQRLWERYEDAAAAVPQLRAFAPEVRKVYAELGALPPQLKAQRVHGDLHLGQVLRAENGWLLTDFEGEPSVPVPERCVMHPTVLDVAGMLRSFDYAAHQASEHPEPDGQLKRWRDFAQDAYCTGYADAHGSDPRDQAVLLRAYTLCKALYETAYEAGNRPDWLHVPLGAVRRITAGASA